MWFSDDAIVVKRRKPNRRRRVARQPLLMVNARVAEQRRERTRRIAAVLLSVIALGGMVWLVVAGTRLLGRALFTENPHYTVVALDLRSEGPILQERHIREYGHLAEGMNLFALNLSDIRKSLQSVPIVASVEITRKLPGTLVVRLNERIALARLGRDDTRHHLAIDQRGHVLGPSSRRPGLPALTGLPNPGYRPGDVIDAPLVGDALKLLDICDTTRLGQVVKIQSIDVRRPDCLDVYLETGERALIGRDRLEWRLTWLARSLQQAVDMNKKIGTIDLTVDKNPPVEWR